MVETENKSEQMYKQLNKNIALIAREFREWHYDTYKCIAKFEDLMEILDMTKQSLYHSINDSRKPSIEKLFKIAEIFNISLDDLCKVDLETSEEWNKSYTKKFENLGKISKAKFE